MRDACSLIFRVFREYQCLCSHVELDLLSGNSNHGVSLSWLFNVRDATPESSIYDSAPVQQEYKLRSSQCIMTELFKY